MPPFGGVVVPNATTMLAAPKVADVTRADVAQLHHDFRHIPYQANRTLGVLSKMFNLAELWGLRAEGANPCRLVRIRAGS